MALERRDKVQLVYEAIVAVLLVAVGFAIGVTVNTPEPKEEWKQEWYFSYIAPANVAIANGEIDEDMYIYISETIKSHLEDPDFGTDSSCEGLEDTVKSLIEFGKLRNKGINGRDSD